MTWLALFRLFLSLADEVAALLRERQLIDAGKALARARHLDAARDALARAEAARAAVRRDLRERPQRLRDDDGHRRD